MDLSDFSLGVGLLIVKVALDAAEHIDALLKILQGFRILLLELVSDANVVHNPCVVGVSLPVFEQQLSRELQSLPAFGVLLLRVV